MTRYVKTEVDEYKTSSQDQDETQATQQQRLDGEILKLLLSQNTWISTELN